MRCPLLSFLRAPSGPSLTDTAAVWIAPEEVVAASQGHAEDVTVLTTRAGAYAVLGELQEVVGEINDALQEGERERRRQLDSLLLGVEAYLEELNPGGPAVRILDAMREEAGAPPHNGALREIGVFLPGDPDAILEPRMGAHIRTCVEEAAALSWMHGGAPREFRHNGARYIVATVRVPDEGDATLPRTRMALAFLEELRERGEAVEGADAIPEWMAEKIRGDERAETGATVAPLFREELREEAVAGEGYDSPARRVARAVWEGATSLDLTDIHGPTVYLRCPTEDAALDLDRALHELAEAGNARAFDPTANDAGFSWGQARGDARRLCDLLGSLPISSAAELSPDGAEALRIVEAALDDAKLLRDYLERTGPRNFVEVTGGPVELGTNARLLTEEPEDFTLRWGLVVRLLTRAYELSHHLPETARMMASPAMFLPEGGTTARASLQGWLAWVRDCYADQLAEVAAP